MKLHFMCAHSKFLLRYCLLYSFIIFTKFFNYQIKKEINKIFTQFHNSVTILFMSYYPPK